MHESYYPLHMNKEMGSETLHNLLSLTGRNLPSQMFMNLVRKFPFNMMQLCHLKEKARIMAPSLRICMIESQLLFSSLTLDFLISKMRITYPFHKTLTGINIDS